MKYTVLVIFLGLCFKLRVIKCKNNIDKEAVITSRIVGGVETSTLAYPHVAQLEYKGFHFCGGSIISDRVILTAAHCLVVPESEVTVYLGSADTMTGKQYKVCKYLRHPKYGSVPKIEYYFDIALVLLLKNIRFGARVQKAKMALDYRWKSPNSRMTVAGFGDTVTQGSLAPRLRSTRMWYVDSRVCNQSQSKDDHMYVPPHVFCMIASKWTGPCYGDSGSGVLWMDYLVGIVSDARGKFCGSDTMPSMYTDVVYFKKWIRQNVKELEGTSQKQCGKERSASRSLIRTVPTHYRTMTLNCITSN